MGIGFGQAEIFISTDYRPHVVFALYGIEGENKPGTRMYRIHGPWEDVAECVDEFDPGADIVDWL